MVLELPLITILVVAVVEDMEEMVDLEVYMKEAEVEDTEVMEVYEKEAEEGLEEMVVIMAAEAEDMEKEVMVEMVPEVEEDTMQKEETTKEVEELMDLVEIKVKPVEWEVAEELEHKVGMEFV